MNFTSRHIFIAAIVAVMIVIVVVQFDIGAPPPPPKLPPSLHIIDVFEDAPASMRDHALVTELFRNLTLDLADEGTKNHYSKNKNSNNRFEKCTHVFLDLGANVGVSTRKLFQPHHYPGATFVDLFANYEYRPEKHKAGELCAIMVEPNPKHAPRLRQLADCYSSMGLPTVFVPAGIGSKPAALEFLTFGESDSKGYNHKIDDGAHLAELNSKATRPPGTKSQIVPVITLVQLFHAFQLRGRKHVGAKFDIEGMEYRVFRHLLPRQLLCIENGLRWIAVEPHAFPVDEIVPLDWVRAQQQRARCREGTTNLILFDDESFAHDGKPLPEECSSGSG